MDVVITETEKHALGWARQFENASPFNKKIVVKSAGRSINQVRKSTMAAYHSAAEIARNGGVVIISVGHGVAGVDEEGNQIANFDLAPRIGNKKTLHVTNEHIVLMTERRVQFKRDFLDQVNSMSKKECKIVNATKQSETDPQLTLRKGRCDPNAKKQVTESLAIFDFYMEIGAVMKARNVGIVVLLTCRVGNSPDFLVEVARDWGVAVMAYTRRVELWQDQEDFFRVYLQGDKEGIGTNTEKARTQIPSLDDMQYDDWVIAGPGGLSAPRKAIWDN